MVNKWRVMGVSVVGASHIRNNLPNQDAIKWYPDLGFDLPIIMAISDGHGSQKSFRSDRGSKFAVQIAIDTIREAFFKLQVDINNYSIFKRMAEEQLPKEIERKWKAVVKSDIEQEPFSDKESELLKGKDYLAYGATLLIVFVTELFIFYLQLGDGDILIICENGEIERPLPKDDQLIGNETTSLCSSNAWRDFRFRFQPVLNSLPKMILMATDGYANSFRDEVSFIEVGFDIWQMIKSEGIDFVNDNLKSWLNEASEKGSGDDITVGLIINGALGIKKEYLENICKVTFQLPVAPPDTKSVCLVGDFNDWNYSSHPMKKLKSGGYALEIELQPGREYQFRYLIDDAKWENDWNADRYIRNPYGDSDNSVIIV